MEIDEESGIICDYINFRRIIVEGIKKAKRRRSH